MVKKGYAVCEEKEAYSSKSSVCCHGHLNESMKNGQLVETYKRGKYVEKPEKMPKHIHGILICQKCGSTWNRDFVGAFNILTIYIARMEGLERPERFTLAFWKNKNKKTNQIIAENCNISVNLPG